MSNNQKWVVITDLDGTLLDHHSYTWEAAKPALRALRAAGIPLILNSSKTRSEISELREALGNEDPYIVENGAAVVIPADYFEPGPERLVPFSEPRAAVLDVLRLLADQGFRFRNFDGMSASELADVTGLSVPAASRAKRRDATEPLLWQDTDDALESFRQALASHQLRLIKGGRFYHVMGCFDKAAAMQYLLAQYRRLYPDSKVLSIALGDSPNDLQMLEQADTAVVVKGKNQAEMILPSHPNLTYTDKAGPDGWNDAMLGILDSL